MLKKMPKSGGWLNSVKVVLGFVEIALGFKFLSTADQAYGWGLLDREIYLAIWIVVFTLLCLYLLGKIRFAHDSEVKHIGVGRLGLVIAVFTFVVYMIPGMWGAPLKGLSGYLPPMHTQAFRVQTVKVKKIRNAKYRRMLHLPHDLAGYFELKQAEEAAAREGKPLFIDFTGHGCVNCREMEARVWSNEQVLQLLRDEYVVVALYTDDKMKLEKSDWVTAKNGDVLKTLGAINANYALTRFGVNAQPYYVLQGKKGAILGDPRGYDLSVEGFVEFLRKGVEEFNK
jgi:thiol:disulfide interchange protein DsbD